MAPTAVREISSTAIATQAEAAPPALAVIDKGMLSTADVIARTTRIREVMEAVMKPNVHYGIIPGTPKPTMFQPGADVLNVTFRIAPTIQRIDDLSTEDAVRYRVTLHAVHQPTGEVLADGIGECSSQEEKYRWRRAVCDEEWQEMDGAERRTKWQRGKNNSAYPIKQVRVSPADVANTVLKMAFKRAKVAMTLNATAASDVFAQDLDDLAEELREHLVEADGADEKPKARADAKPMPQRKTETPAPAGETKPVAGETRAPAAETKAPAPLHVAQVHTREHQGAPYYVVELASGQKLSTRDDAVATAADALVSRQVPVRLLTADQAAKDAGVDGTAILVYTPPPDANRSPRLERVIA